MSQKKIERWMVKFLLLEWAGFMVVLTIALYVTATNFDHTELTTIGIVGLLASVSVVTSYYIFRREIPKLLSQLFSDQRHACGMSQCDMLEAAKGIADDRYKQSLVDIMSGAPPRTDD